MITRVLLVLASGAALAACQPAVPDSGAGVGFEEPFAQQQAQRDAALAGTVPAPASVSSEPLSAIGDPSAAATAAETQRVLDATNPNAPGLGSTAATNSGVDPVIASPSNPAPAVVNSDGISQENNFDAVSAQRGIQGDAERLAAARAQYQVVQPEALPSRTASGPNIVSYALSSSHSVGTRVYRRFGANRTAKFQRACAKYNSADQAQIDFLASGGPERDRKGVDPDGDGFACAWDPAPFRKAKSAGLPAPEPQATPAVSGIPGIDAPLVISDEN